MSERKQAVSGAPRVLVAEPLAARGLDALREAGFDVEVRIDMDRASLLKAVEGAAALIIRSATQVDSEVLDAGRSLVVVGRAGIGLDNVDVKAATTQGVMVVNAPQSNILSAAEHTLALLLAQARNIPQAHADLTAGKWNRSKWEGVELNGKVLGIAGLGRVGVLVAQRALAFGMRLVAYDPYVAPERARQLGVALVDTVAELIRESDFVSIHLPKTAETTGLIGAGELADAKPTLRIINTARGGIIDEAALADAVREGRIAGAALDVFVHEPTTTSPLFALDSVVVTPHLGASTAEAQDKASVTIAEQVILALRGEFVPFAVNVAASEASETVRPYLPLVERLGSLFTALAGGTGDSLEISYEGQIADYDCSILTLSALRGVLSPGSTEPVSYVNAPQLASERGLVLRESKSSSSRDYVNLVTLRGSVAGRSVHVAGTLAGKNEALRLVAIDEHAIDMPPSQHMLVVHNEDRPGMIGKVASALGAAGVNISAMDVGRGPEGVNALMVLSTDAAVPADVLAELGAEPGIVDAKAIELG